MAENPIRMRNKSFIRSSATLCLPNRHYQAATISVQRPHTYLRVSKFAQNRCIKIEQNYSWFSENPNLPSSVQQTQNCDKLCANIINYSDSRVRTGYRSCVRNRGGGGGLRPDYSKSPEGRIILSPIRIGLFQLESREDVRGRGSFQGGTTRPLLFQIPLGGATRL